MNIKLLDRDLMGLPGQPGMKASEFLIKNNAEHGIALIQIDGPLSNEGTDFATLAGQVSYPMLYEQISAAAADESVQEIILWITSPGGDAAGVEDLARYIASIEKEVTAYVPNMGASAAYFLAAACDNIYASPGALVGSIGTVMYIPEDKDVYVLTNTQAKYKAADPATVEGKDYLTSLCDSISSSFIDFVKEQRPFIKDEVFEGKLYTGRQAVEFGLVDGLISWIEARRAFDGLQKDNTLQSENYGTI